MNDGCYGTSVCIIRLWYVSLFIVGTFFLHPPPPSYVQDSRPRLHPAVRTYDVRGVVVQALLAGVNRKSMSKPGRVGSTPGVRMTSKGTLRGFASKEFYGPLSSTSTPYPTTYYLPTYLLSL
jgi:hypothetical protein